MAMQKLNVRFSDEVKKLLSETSNDLRMNDSDVARAALNIGLKSLRDECFKAVERRDFSAVNMIVAVNSIK